MVFWGIVGAVLLVVLLAAWRVGRKGTATRIDTSQPDFARDAAEGYAAGVRNRFKTGPW